MSKTRCGICGTGIKASQMFCRTHWFQLPKDLRDQVWEAHRKGDRDKSLELYSDCYKLLRQMNPRKKEPAS